MAANSYCQVLLLFCFWFLSLFPTIPTTTHTHTFKTFCWGKAGSDLQFQSQYSIFSCTSSSLGLKASLIVRFKGLQSLQQRRWWREQETARCEKEAKPASCQELSPCLSVQTDWPTGTSSALLHRGMMAAGYFKVEVSKRPPTGNRTDRPAAVRELASIWAGCSTEAGLCYITPKSRLFIVPIFLIFMALSY